MKIITLAASVLALSAGFAAAEVTLSGDARMGIISSFDLLDGAPNATGGFNPIGVNESDLAFTSRARVKFTLSGSSDGGLEFGASFRADNAGAASSGTAGSAFISGAFGKLSMGDVDGAANAAIGQVSGVGLTGLNDVNEIYFNNGGSYLTTDPSALYEYSTGDLTIYAAVTQPSGASDAYGVGVKYALGDYTVSAAYERLDFAGLQYKDIYVGGTASFGAVTVKAIFGQETIAGFSGNGNQWAVSVDYKADALTVTAFYADDSELGLTVDGRTEGYGLGASYDLGGGASVVGGYVKNVETDLAAYDLGVAMAF